MSDYIPGIVLIALSLGLSYVIFRGYWYGGFEEEYPDDRDDYAREQAIEDGRFEYER